MMMAHQLLQIVMEILFPLEDLMGQLISIRELAHFCFQQLVGIFLFPSLIVMGILFGQNIFLVEFIQMSMM